MLLEDQRYIHEDLERLEQGIADRMGEEPKHVSSLPPVASNVWTLKLMRTRFCRFAIA